MPHASPTHFAERVLASFEKQNAIRVPWAAPDCHQSRSLCRKGRKETLYSPMQQTIMIMHGKTEK